MTRNTLVVGASGGLGGAIAEHMAQGDMSLFCLSRRRPRHGHWIEADLISDTGLRTVELSFDQIALDALIYAAGTWETDAFTDGYGFADGPEADIDRVMALNLTVPMKLVRRLLPAIRRSDAPRVVLIGALSGLDNRATREVANSASKYGLRGAAHAMRLELPDVPVTVINPGNVATDEVLSDIESGRFGEQEAIPMTDFLRILDAALSLSPLAVATEINLAQTHP